jgi:hypothetical protein
MAVDDPYGAPVAGRDTPRRLAVAAVVIVVGVALTVVVALLTHPAHGAAPELGTVRGSVPVPGGETRELDLAVDFDPTLPPAPPPRPICDGIVDGVFTSVPCDGPPTLPTLPGPLPAPPPAPPAVALVAPPGFVPSFAG